MASGTSGRCCETGPALGSKELAEGRIFINTQSWAVLSRVAEGERAQAGDGYGREVLFAAGAAM